MLLLLLLLCVLFIVIDPVSDPLSLQLVEKTEHHCVGPGFGNTDHQRGNEPNADDWDEYFVQMDWSEQFLAIVIIDPLSLAFVK
jgi:hypothetical protein